MLRSKDQSSNSHIEILRNYKDITADGPAGRYVASLMRQGASSYVQSAHIAIRGLLVDGQLLPLVINPGTNTDAAVWSPYAHYYQYTLEEFCKRHAWITSASVQWLASPFGAALRVFSFDKVLFVNNWLLATNPGLRLSSAQIRAVTHRLVKEYPEFAIIFRSVNPVLDESVYGALVENGYRLVRSRRVYLLDGRGTQHLRRHNTRRDLELLKSSPYQVIGCHTNLEMHASRMAELYRSLYIDKHSRLNPHFDSEFFRLTLKENVLTYWALSKDGRIDAFIGFFLQDNLMSAAIMGYDQNPSRKFGLYRAAMALLISSATERRLVLNLGGGAGQFKMLRGAVPTEEFDAVYDRHLPVARRLPWTALRLVGLLRAATESRTPGS